MEKKLKVWWKPQIPMTPSFEVEVASVSDGAKLMDILASYDAFQFTHRIKPDYCNAGGLIQLDDDGEWSDWCDDETGESDPSVYVRANVYPHSNTVQGGIPAEDLI